MIVGVGTDVVDIARVRRMLDARGDRMLRRLFTAAEAAYSCARPDPATHLAARLAAKEAAFKALAGNELARGIGWHDLEVLPFNGTRPEISLHGRAHTRATELGVVHAWLSLTHSETTAVAFVVLERD